jgi:hypothetical protein
MEFTFQFHQKDDGKTETKLFILQCRPQSHLQEQSVRLPERLEEKKVVFSTSRVSPHGKVEGIRYVIFVPHEAYFSLPSLEKRHEVTRGIGKLNKVLEGETFICVGPGRWGTVNSELGVSVTYADIYNTRALVEISGQGVGAAPEPSYGTHFFQDLIESQIFPLAVHLDDSDAVFNRSFFYDSLNRLTIWLPELASMEQGVKLIAVDDVVRGYIMDLIMDSEAGRAVAFLKAEGK